MFRPKGDQTYVDDYQPQRRGQIEDRQKENKITKEETPVQTVPLLTLSISAELFKFKRTRELTEHIVTTLKAPLVERATHPPSQVREKEIVKQDPDQSGSPREGARKIGKLNKAEQSRPEPNRTICLDLGLNPKSQGSGPRPSADLSDEQKILKLWPGRSLGYRDHQRARFPRGNYIYKRFV